MIQAQREPTKAGIATSEKIKMKKKKKETNRRKKKKIVHMTMMDIATFA